ncbi:hypothetical protein LZ31DRAFT_561163 [Colletotrichum somersetense]|nr:hypothetical protein LZ31DRAFT_561163 [Colletotrichum somersetense]
MHNYEANQKITHGRRCYINGLRGRASGDCFLALEMVQADKKNGNHRSKAFIYTDDQAAIRSSAKPKGKSGAYLLRIIADKTQALREQGLDVELRWVPVHTSIQGNEVSHVLLRCRKYRQLRRQELGALPGRHNLRVILNERKAAAKTIRFIEQTEILGQHGIES